MGPNGLGGAEGFLQFITDELAPAIEDLYGGDPDDRALLGFSLGGLFTAYALLQEGLLKRFIIGSPSLWWDNRMMFELEERRAEGPGSCPPAPSYPRAKRRKCRMASFRPGRRW
jgi:predicted alpha/beta superfamily hydrolase